MARLPAFPSAFIAAAIIVSMLAAAQAARAQVDQGSGANNFPASPDNSTATLKAELELARHTADLLDQITKDLELIKPVVRNVPEVREILNQLDAATGYTKNMADLKAAFMADWAEKRNPAAEGSQTRRTIANIALHYATDPDRLQDLALLGFIQKSAARKAGAFMFGAGDAAEGVGLLIKHGAGNVEGIEKTVDGITATAVGGYTFRTVLKLSHNPGLAFDVGQAFATAYEVGAENIRELTFPQIKRITEQVTGAAQLNATDDTFIAIWEQSQRSRVAHGQAVQNIAQFYHGDVSILRRIEQAELAPAYMRLGLPTPPERLTSADFKPAPNAGSKPPLGGIELDQPLTGAALRGVKIDAASGNIVLVGERDFLARGLKLRDFAMALWLVFGPQARDPEFSLDPDDINNPRGPWLRALYIPDALQGRSFGADLFAADLLLKELSFQVRPNAAGKLEEWKSTVPGFHSYAELALADPGDGSNEEQWARFWIVADQVTSRQAGDTLLFEARMAVKARRQVPDPASPTGLRDIDTDPASLEARWAQSATDHYEALAAESPALARVRDMAIAIGIAKSLKAAGAQVELARVADLLNDDHSGTVSKIGAFTISRQQRSETPFQEGNKQGMRVEIRTIRLFGGVDLSVDPRTIRDDNAARSMGDAVETAFGLADRETHIVRFVQDGSQLVAVALPLLVQK